MHRAEQVIRHQRVLGRLRADLEFRDVQELLQEDLHAFLDRLQESVRDVADAIAAHFFRLSTELQLYALTTT